MSVFVDVKVRLRIADSRQESQIWTAEGGESEWSPVSDKLPKLAEALKHLSEERLHSDLNDYRTRQMIKFFGEHSDPRQKLIRSAIKRRNLDQSELRILLEPLDEGSRAYAYGLPAEIWSFSSDQPSGYLEPDNPLPSIVRLVQQDRLASRPVPKKWRIAWIGGDNSIDTLREVRDSFRGPGITFAGAFPLLYAEDLRESLNESGANIVWLVGAGDQKSSSFSLSEDQKIGVAELCNGFRYFESVQLLFIHSCHIGNLSTGLAQRLIQEIGIPMIVTWETRNGDDEGLLQKKILPPFANKFFTHFREGKPAEMALAIARNHLFRNVYGNGILNCKACPLAFKATNAGEIEIEQVGQTVPKKPKPRPRPDGKGLLQRLAQAYRLEESLDINKALEIYETLTNCSDKEISQIAHVRITLISFKGANAPPNSTS